MSKSPVKLTQSQIAQIKILFAEGKTIYQIHKQLRISSNTVRYHIERVQLASLNKQEHKVPVTQLEFPLTPTSNSNSSDDIYLSIIEELKNKNKKLIEILTLN